MITSRRWLYFTDLPPEAVIAIVMEFYSNARKQPDGKVTVQGRPVSYTRQTINALFRLLNFSEDEENYLFRLPVDLDEVSRVLCKPGTVWITKYDSAEKLTFPHTSLSRYAKA